MVVLTDILLVELSDAALLGTEVEAALAGDLGLLGVGVGGGGIGVDHLDVVD